MHAFRLHKVLCLAAVAVLCQCRITKLPSPAVPLSAQSRAEGQAQLRHMEGGTFFSYQAQDGAFLGGYRHPAKGAKRLTLIALHGFQSHAGWLAGTAKQLSAQGVDVWCPDRRGSGINTAGRFPAGDIRDWRIWERDLAALVQHLRRVDPQHEIALLGYSWGSVTSLAYLQQCAESKTPSGISKVILLTPGTAPKTSNVPAEDKVRTVLSLATAQSQIFIPTPANTAGLHAAKAALAEDPRMMRTATARYLWQVQRMKSHVVRHLPALANAEPMHVILAEHDNIVDNATIRKQLSQLASITVIPNASHTLPLEDAAGLAKVVLAKLKPVTHP